jgi:hypothetical protein
MGQPKQKRDVENDAYAAFVRRAIRAYGRRVALGDLDALRELVDLGDELRAATNAAVAGLRDEPNAYSWQRIADELGVTRQAAMMRWPDAPSPRKPGGQPSELR